MSRRSTGSLARTLIVMTVGACGIAERTVEERDASEGQGGSSSQASADGGMGTGGASVGGTTAGVSSATGGSGVMAGFGTGGKALPGGAPNASCETKFLPYEPTCDAPPVPDTTWCVPAAGGDGAGGDGAIAPAFDVVDDLEDIDELTPFVLGGRGAWFYSNDGSGQQFPTPCMVRSPQPYATAQNRFAMRTYGAFFSTLPGGFSNIGIALRSGEGCVDPIDASKASHVSFSLYGRPGFVRFSVATVATSPTTNQGSCLAQCWDAHGVVLEITGLPTTHHVPLAMLVQEGWGTPAVFDRSQILGMQWSAKATPEGSLPAGCFDFWVDDVIFERLE